VNATPLKVKSQVNRPTSLDLGELCADDLGRLADWGYRFVRLAGGAIDGLDPQTTLSLVISSEHDLISLAHSIEKVLAAVQT